MFCFLELSGISFQLFVIQIWFNPDTEPRTRRAAFNSMEQHIDESLQVVVGGTEEKVSEVTQEQESLGLGEGAIISTLL